MTRPDASLLVSLASALASRLGIPTAVDASGVVAVGHPGRAVRIAVEPRDGGLAVVTPVLDASGDLVSVLTGPVRDPADRDGLLSDLSSHFEESRSSDLPFHAASCEVAKAVSDAVLSETGRVVVGSVIRRPDAGFDVDVVSFDGVEDLLVFVVEHAAWVRSDGRDLPARDHSDRDSLVCDFVGEIVSAPVAGVR